MQIQAKVALNLPNKFYKITLKYNTFEKATYDSFLVASIVANAKTEREAEDYIDDITGKGSLNPHFKKLYKEISVLSKKEIRGILDDSLYPVTVIDQKHHFKYYPMFDVTRMEGKVFRGNLKDDPGLSQRIMPRDDQAKFLSIDFLSEDGIIQPDNYDARFSDDGIEVCLDGDTFYPISEDDFLAVYKSDIENVSDYEGKIHRKMTDGKWYVLNNAILNSIKKAPLFFVDNDYNHCEVLNDCVKKTEIIQMFSLYFYKETRFEYSRKNESLCEDVIDYLMASNKINEIKTKNLINLLFAISDKTAQKVISFILSRKDSKEIAEMGLRLIKRGLEKGWDSDVLKSIKKYASKGDYQCLYQINSNLGFLVEDFLDIEDAVLSKEDLDTKKEYLSKKLNMQTTIRDMIGEMAMSGVRQKMKKLPTKDQVYSTLNTFLNKYIGHTEKDYDAMSFEQIKDELEKIRNIYVGAYTKIKERCEKEEE